MPGAMNPRFDVVTLGETMLRLTPPALRRIEQTQTFDLEIGGSESNTSVGLARMGLKVAWVSRLTDNALGRYIARGVAAHGVDVSQVVWTREHRVGVYFLEEGRPPRPSRVIYDRADSAFSHMTPADLPLSVFAPGGARLLHVTGITPALGPTTAETAWVAVDRAKQAGWQVSLDLNYRSQLWSPAEASAGLARFVAAADIVFAPLNDAQTIFGLSGSPEAVLAAMRERNPRAVMVMTLGASGSLAHAPGMDAPVRQATYEAVEVGRVGGGDAFSAGFLYGWLSADGTEPRLPRALRYGAAVAALKYTVLGDLPLVDAAEVHQLAETGRTARLIR